MKGNEATAPDAARVTPTRAPTRAPRPPLDELGRVVAEPARLRILLELLGGVALPAGALAARLDLAPSTISAHLARLHDADLIEIEQHGRTRLARLADPAVAEAIEALARLSDESPVHSLNGFHSRTAMREARSCYDHLAGRVGVALADIALDRGWIRDHGGAWALPDSGADAFARGIGLHLSRQRSSRPEIRPCSDWTERRHHIAGRFGRCLLDAMLENDWLRRRPGDRALTITALGKERLTALGVPGLWPLRP